MTKDFREATSAYLALVFLATAVILICIEVIYVGLTSAAGTPDSKGQGA